MIGDCTPCARVVVAGRSVTGRGEAQEL